jgi:hypothetical protein
MLRHGILLLLLRNTVTQNVASWYFVVVVVEQPNMASRYFVVVVVEQPNMASRYFVVVVEKHRDAKCCVTVFCCCC